MTRRTLTVWVILAAGCGSVDVIPDRFYRLAPPPVAAVPGPSPLVLRVDDFSVAPHLAGDRLVAVVDEHRLVPYPHDLWAAPLDRLVTDAVLRGLLSAGRFRAVLDNRDAAGANWVLSGRVLSFEGVVDGGRLRVRASATFSLREEGSGRLIWQGRIEREVPAGCDSAGSVVAALNEALAGVSTELAVIAEREGAAALGRAAPQR